MPSRRVDQGGQSQVEFEFWMVWVEGTSQVTRKHGTPEQAEEEARRLAHNNPTKRVWTLHSEALFRAQAAPIVRVEPVPAPLPDLLPRSGVAFPGWDFPQAYRVSGPLAEDTPPQTERQPRDDDEAPF